MKIHGAQAIRSPTGRRPRKIQSCENQAVRTLPRSIVGSSTQEDQVTPKPMGTPDRVDDHRTRIPASASIRPGDHVVELGGRTSDQHIGFGHRCPLVVENGEMEVHRNAAGDRHGRRHRAFDMDLPVLVPELLLKQRGRLGGSLVGVEDQSVVQIGSAVVGGWAANASPSWPTRALPARHRYDSSASARRR